MWGYKPIPGAKTPEEEKPTLDRVGARAGREAVPALLDRRPGRHRSRATTPKPSATATRSTATTLGLKNLARVSEMLVAATTTKAGDPWDELEEVYGRMAGQWTTELGHVVKVIGGVDSQQKHIGQEGVRFTTVPKARQKEAVQFLLQNAF